MPAVSRATAVHVRVPSPTAGFHATEYGEEESASRFEASIEMAVAPQSPSCRGLAETGPPDTVAEAAAPGNREGGPTLSTLTVTEQTARWFTRSVARAVTTCAPERPVVLQLAEYGTVVSGAPRDTSLTKNSTPGTAVSSAAVARIETVPLTQLFAVGAVTLAVGAVVSGGRT